MIRLLAWIERNWLVVTETGCWEWQRCRDPHGYGRLRRNGVTDRTHRIAWRQVNGPIPDGLFVCHKCDNPPCCNPEHLFLGDNAANVADRVAKGRTHNQLKTHCPQGHPYDEVNTDVRIRGDGSINRRCRTCHNARTRAKQLAKVMSRDGDFVCAECGARFDRPKGLSGHKGRRHPVGSSR